MKLEYYNYRERKVCPNCFSLSIKKSYKEYKCYNCEIKTDKILTVELMHRGKRCIDNNVESRKIRYDKYSNKVIYEG